MSDRRKSDLPPEEHDEYHSALEVDDSSGWRVMVIPVLLIVLVIGMIAAFIIYEDDVEPDPRVQAHLERKAREAERTQQPVQPARVPAIQPDAMAPAEGEGAAPAAGEPVPEPAG